MSLFSFSSSERQPLLNTSNQIQININGNSSDLSYYYLNLSIGDPKETQSLIIDTSAPITAAPCKPFNKNENTHINNYFQSNDDHLIYYYSDKCQQLNQTQEKNGNCGFYYYSLDGSEISGVYVNEYVALIDNKYFSTQMPIGCIEEETHSFNMQKANGILSLTNSENTIIDILYKEKKISKNLFTICLGNNGGYISIGELYPENFKDAYIVYIDMNKGSFFELNITSVNVANYTYNETIYKAVIESGTTLTYFPHEIYSFIISGIKQNCNESYGEAIENKEDEICFKFKDDASLKLGLKEWPDISFSLNNDYNFVWYPINYYVEKKDSEGNLLACLGFVLANLDYIVLGNTWMRGYDIIFNKQEQIIGFVESNCDKGISEKRMNELKNFEILDPVEKGRREKEQREREQREREQREKEQREREQREREQREKEQREKEQREKEQREKEQREREQREKEQREKEQREREQREKQRKKEIHTIIFLNIFLVVFFLAIILFLSFILCGKRKKRKTKRKNLNKHIHIPVTEDSEILQSHKIPSTSLEMVTNIS